MNATEVDAFFNAGDAAATLSSLPDRIRLRAASSGVEAPSAAPTTQKNANGDYGPPPSPRVDLELGRDEANQKIGSVEVQARALSWSFDRAAGDVVATMKDGEKLIVAQTLCASTADAEAELRPFADALCRYARLTPESAAEPSEPAPPPLARRYTMQLEGSALVLRDHESVGPKERVARYRGLALACVILGLVGTVAFIDRVSSSASTITLVGAAIPPVVLFIAAFAMSEIARYANRYQATSAPLAWFADDRIVVAPWVSREGAIDTKPEGRLGAAVTCGEITSVEVVPRQGAFAVTLAGLHGPIEVLVTTDRAIADRAREAIELAIAKVASPKKRVTALMRAATSRRQTAEESRER